MCYYISTIMHGSCHAYEGVAELVDALVCQTGEALPRVGSSPTV